MSNKQIIGGLIAFIVVLLGAGGYFVKTFLSEDMPQKTNNITMLTLPKAPRTPEKEPPPKQEPPREIQEKRESTDQEKGEIVDSGPRDEPQRAESNTAPASVEVTRNPDPVPAGVTHGSAPAVGESSDNTPAGDRLGLDTEGTAGSDAFGLVARKGGRSIIAGKPGPGKVEGSESAHIGAVGAGKAGGSGSQSVKLGGRAGKVREVAFDQSALLDKFGWYTQIVKAEISKKIQRHLDETSGIPRGKYQTVVRVSLDSTGAVVQCGIVDSSGNHEMDEIVMRFLAGITISELPPEGMPRTIIIRITSQS